VNYWQFTVVFLNLLFLISLILSESLLKNEIIHYKFGNSKHNLLLISLSKYVTASDLKNKIHKINDV
jgi:hypothetical protein